MKKLLVLIMATLLISGCQRNGIRNADELLKVDRDFSQLSSDSGRNKAFIAYVHDSAVLLRQNSLPIVGKSAIVNILQRPDTTYRLTWEPLYASIAESGELGYTYGIYTFQADSTVEKGTYITIWRKTSQGWRYVLDTGNEGLGSNK